MTLTKLWPLFLLLSVATLSTPTFGGTPTPEAQVLIETLGLTEADTPIGKHPGWKPGRVIVMLLPKMGIGTAAR
jgi:hypothetical protein